MKETIQTIIEEGRFNGLAPHIVAEQINAYVEEEVNQRTMFKMEELLTAVSNTSKHLWNGAANTGDPRLDLKRQAFDHFAEMIKKEMEMPVPNQNMAMSKFREWHHRTVQEISDRLQLRGKRDRFALEKSIAAAVERAMKWNL